MKTAFLFPGQGAQYPGMGKSLCEKYDIAREIAEKSDEKLGFSLTDRLFNGTEDEIKKTEITQPGILMVSNMVSEILKAEGIEPDAAAGLSLGEYSALVEAGSLDYYEALELVSRRGKLMEEAVPSGKGAMCAVIGMDTEKIEETVNELSDSGIIKIANYNCPGQIVISGETGTVEKAAEVLKEKGAKRCIMLSVSGPFHTEMMEGAGEKLGKLLEETEIKEPEIDIYLNVTGEKYGGEDIRENLVKQISSSVRFQNIIENMIEDGVRVFIEAGVGKTLSSFVKKTAKKMKAEVTVLNAEDAESLEKALEKIKEI